MNFVGSNNSEHGFFSLRLSRNYWSLPSFGLKSNCKKLEYSLRIIMFFFFSLSVDRFSTNDCQSSDCNERYSNRFCSETLKP